MVGDDLSIARVMPSSAYPALCRDRFHFAPTATKERGANPRTAANRPMKLPMHRVPILVLVGLLTVAACTGRASVTIRNGSGAQLQDVRVEGRCFAEKIGYLPPGAAGSVRVKPCGESGVFAKFTAVGIAHEAPEVGYIEANSSYSVTLVIGPDFTVRESP